MKNYKKHAKITKNLTKNKISASKIKKTGFSLVEVIFSIFFLTIIIFGVVKLQSSNLAMLVRQNNQTTAYFYANQGISIISALKYDSNLYDECKLTGKLIKNIVFDDNKYSLKNQTAGNEKIDSTIFERYIEIDCENSINAYKTTCLIEWEDSTGPHRKYMEINGQTKEMNAHVEAKRMIFK